VTNGHLDRQIAERAVAQDGMFTHRQARDVGLSQRQIEHRIREELWVPSLPGVFRNAATPETPEGARRGALLWAGPDAVLSHRSAAAMWVLDGISGDHLPEITVVGKRHPKSDLVVVHRTLALSVHDVRTRADQKVTAPTRTIIDLASVLDPEALESAVESARRMRLTTAAQITRRMECIGGRGRRGAAQLNEILDAIGGAAPSESPLEVKVARLLRASSVPKPVRQYSVGIFGRRYRLDFAWPAIRLALECDGERFHRFQRDRSRWRRLSASGWRVLPVTWKDVVGDWAAVEREILAAFATSGRPATLDVAQ
jgi:very-short-patch-repair endonuclease